jgi:hypothetical protein
MDRSGSDSGAVEPSQVAREESDQRAAQYDPASGSLRELPAYT